MSSHSKASTSRNNLISLAAFTGLFLIYVAFPTQNYYYDGIFFARAIEEATSLKSSLIHPNHLIYSPFGYLVYRFTQILGFTLRAVQVLQFINSIASVLSAYVLFRISRESFQSRYLAWCLTFLFAFSATWWKFSTDVDAYIISVFFLLICFYLILPTRSPHPLLLVGSFSFAVFFHQLAVLFYPIIILGLIWQTDSHHKRRRLVVLQFAVGAFVLIFTTYCYSFYLAAGTFSPSRFALWSTSYSPDVSFSFDVLSNLRYTLRGHLRLFFGGRFGFIKDLPGYWSVLMVIWVALVGIFILSLIQTLRKAEFMNWAMVKEQLHLDDFAKLCGLWILIFVAFLFFWLPHNTLYRLFYLPAIVLLIGWIISKGPRISPKYRLAILVAAMMIANFLFSILPYTNVEQNPPLALALELNKAWPAGTVVYYASENSDNNLVRYFNPNTIWKPLVDRQQLETNMKDSTTQDKAIWLETTAIDRILAQADGVNWLASHVKLESRRELVDRAHRIRFFQINL